MDFLNGGPDDGDAYNVVFLNPEQTEVIMSDDEKNAAIDYALQCMYDTGIGATVDVQRMAKFVLWSLQRLGAIEQCVGGDITKQ